MSHAICGGALGGIAGARLRPIRAGLRSAVIVVALLALASLSGCAESGRTAGGGERKSLVVAIDTKTGREFVTTRREASQLQRFLSAENQRETVFSGNTASRIASDGRSEPTGFLNLGRVNRPGAGTGTGEGEFFSDLSGQDIVVEPLREQQIVGGQWQAPLSRGGTITLNFTDEPLDQVVRSVLGGILGVNYLIGDSVTGTLTFRSEERFTNAQVLQALADILARNGYMIQYFNGIYHVGEPDELDTLTGLRGRTALEGDATHTVVLRRAPPENLVDVVNALVPPGNTVLRMSGTNTLAVRGDPSQFESVENLIRSLVEARPGTQALAIVPVRRSPPELLAERIIAIYAERNLGDPLILPVESAPGILVVADDRATVNQVAEIVRRLDVENRDTPQVRVIQLSHLDAEELAGRLAAVLGEAGAGGAQAAASPAQQTQSNIIAAAIEGASAGDAARPTTRTGLQAPRFIRSPGENGAEAAGANGAANGNGVAQPARAGGGGGTGEAITFAADTRNNALLVRSNFAEFQRIQEVVRALDVPLAQVVIEATIVEVDINDSLQYGVQNFLQARGVNLRSSNLQAPADPGGAGFVGLLDFSIGSVSIQTVLKALQSVTNVRVISSPYLTVVDGASSRLSVGDQIPFTIASQTSSSGGTVTVTQEVDTRDVGVILNVTPRISPDNTVLLDIVQEVSQARPGTAPGSNPVIAQRSMQSQITIRSGSTVLLGGLIQERTSTSEDGVPVMRKVPVVGNLFNTTRNTQTRSELLVMITPRVVRNSDALAGLTRELRRQAHRP